MKKIPLTQGKVALVDDEDYEWLSQWKWNAYRDKGVWYAKRQDWNGGKERTIRMHREILGLKDPEVPVDHRNHDGLDNQKSNLREASGNKNQSNMRKQADRSSRYKGVSWRKDNSKWAAYIRNDGHLFHLGYFANEEDAAQAYNRAAIICFGEFAELNK